MFAPRFKFPSACENLFYPEILEALKMREEVKSTMDFVPVETMWGDRDIWLTIEPGAGVSDRSEGAERLYRGVAPHRGAKQTSW